MPTKLSVNVNKIALLRNTRDYGIPSVIRAARTCISAGVAGITVHPRPDQRHITTQDVYDLKALLADHPDVEYNIEGNPFEGKYLKQVLEVGPHQATLVPDTPGQRTSDHGWDPARDGEKLIPIVEQLHAKNIRVSLFMNADSQLISQVPATGADRVELYTESYATAFRAGDPNEQLAIFAAAAQTAADLGLGVNAGHDLNRANLGLFCKGVPNLLEVSIGHELVSDALWLGLEETVKQYLSAIAQTQ